MRCYPLNVFELAAEVNGWRLRDTHPNHTWVIVVSPIGRLIVTRHCNGRAQVQGVDRREAWRQDDAERVIGRHLSNARDVIINEIAVMEDVTERQAERMFEDAWQAEKSGSTAITRPMAVEG